MTNATLYFIHIPRTAGTYLTRFFEQELGDRFVREGHTVPAGTLKPWTERFGPEHFQAVRREDCLTFAVVRNPFDLLVSMYVWGFPYWPPRDYAGAGKINWPFRSFRDYVVKLTDTNEYPWIVPEQRKSLFFQLFDRDGRLIPDVIIRQERLKEGVSHIGRMLGHDWTAPATPINGVPRMATQDFYDRDLVRRVEDHFAGDLERFGYGFGGYDGPEVIDPKHTFKATKKSFGGSLTGDCSDKDLHRAELVSLVPGRRLVSELVHRVRRRA